jgi:hypothetical protein
MARGKKASNDGRRARTSSKAQDVWPGRNGDRGKVAFDKLVAERDRLKKELATARRRIKQLEKATVDITARVETAIESIRNVLGD